MNTHEFTSIRDGAVLLLSSGEVVTVDGRAEIYYDKSTYLVECSHGRVIRGDLRTPYLGANYDDLVPIDEDSHIVKIFSHHTLSDCELEIENLELKYHNKCLLLAEDQYLEKIQALQDKLDTIKRAIKIVGE